MCMEILAIVCSAAGHKKCKILTADHYSSGYKFPQEFRSQLKKLSNNKKQMWITVWQTRSIFVHWYLVCLFFMHCKINLFILQYSELHFTWQLEIARDFWCSIQANNCRPPRIIFLKIEIKTIRWNILVQIN
jgi:hypothetical protein